MKLVTFLVFMSAFFPTFANAVEDAYPRTAPGVIEIKQLPAARLLLAESSNRYFSSNNQLFGKLFRYISSNQIPMTAPVEARMDPGVMVFYMDSQSQQRADVQPSAEVKFQDLPVRLVAAIGIRGSYSEENYTEALTKLQTWLAVQADYEVTGEAYGVYWNSPFVPFFLKQSEVHIPVQLKKSPGAP
jgi:effector-binding domain-containing protein